MNLSFAWFKYGDYVESEKITLYILDQFGLDNFKLLYRLGKNYSAKKRYEEAVKTFEMASDCIKSGSQEFKDVQSMINNAKKSKKALDDKKRAQFNRIFS